MQIKDHYKEGAIFTNRVIIASILVVIALLILISRLIQLQVVNHDHFQTLSKDNRLKLVPLPPKRGLIFDRNGVALAVNKPEYNLEIIPENVENLSESLSKLQRILNISDYELKRFKRLKKNKRLFESVPIKTNLTIEEVSIFSVNKHLFPGIEIEARLKRYYPFANLTGHVLGYVGRISKNDLKKINSSNYAGTSFIGKTGVERSYESSLHGEVGRQQVEVNSVGRIARTLEKKDPKSGEDLHLHLDITLQKTAIDALGENNGAIVAIDPSNGGILALVSKPGFDPNNFVGGISEKKYKNLKEDIDRPLFDRALNGQYPPGSTVKPFIGLAGLELNHLSSNTTNYCAGFFQLPGNEHKYRDWKRAGHGEVTLQTAISQSCDVFYYELAYDLGIDKLSQFLKKFGFGEKSGIDLLGESNGILPSKEWKAKQKKEPWYPGETVIMGIGQGYYLSTPLQLAAATAAIANDGKYFKPRVVDFLKVNEEEDHRLIPSASKTISIKKDNLRKIQTAMVDVVESPLGTARNILNRQYTIAGKTGTSQVFSIAQDKEYEEETIVKKKRDHALFIAYAPVDSPKIALAVVVENGGNGGAVAAPIAQKILDKYLLPRKK